MNHRLKKYLEECGRATVDAAMLTDLQRAMERAVPEIVKSIRQREDRPPTCESLHRGGGSRRKKWGARRLMTGV